MDTTEQYIKMADTPEIQDGYNVQPEDFLGSPHGSYNPSIWLPRQDQLQEMVIDKKVHNYVSLTLRMIENVEHHYKYGLMAL